MLHLSDIHVDFDYKPGSLATCPKYLCCRDGQPGEYRKSIHFTLNNFINVFYSAPGDTGAGLW